MPDSQTIPVGKLPFRLLLPVYATTLGVIYEGSYWNQFHINVMNYVGLQDVVRLVLFPFLLILPPYLLILAAAARFAAGGDLLGHPDQTRTTRQYHPLRKVCGHIAEVIILPFAAFMYWNVPGAAISTIWTGVALLVAMRLHRTRLIPMIQPDFWRTIIIFSVTIGPALGIVTGRTEAFGPAGFGTRVEAFLPEGAITGLNLAPTIPVTYLGHVNDFDFFCDRGQVLVVRSDTLPAFETKVVKTDHHLRVPFRDPPVNPLDDSVLTRNCAT